MRNQLDDMLESLLILVKGSTFEHSKKAEYLIGWTMVDTLAFLGLAEVSKGGWKATPELVRLAYQSDKFLRSICSTLSDSEEEVEDREPYYERFGSGARGNSWES